MSRKPNDILFLTIHREWFDAIAAGRKKTEYRSRSRHWRTRLEDRKYRAVRFQNGYHSNALVMLVEFRGTRKQGIGRNACYAIRLGRILQKPRRRRA